MTTELRSTYHDTHNACGNGVSVDEGDVFGQFFRYVHNEQDANQSYGFHLNNKQIKSKT